MEIQEHQVPFHLPLARAYVENYSLVQELYEYNPDLDESFHQRQSFLDQRDDSLSCNRQKLVEVLRTYNKRIQNSDASMQNIERLLDPRSSVVIGGQQPGILTGPLYTVYKIFTLLQLSKREEDRLGVPVIPVFWIAGEDHDWDEVNHLFVLSSKNTVHKKVLPTRVKGKASISHIPIDKEEVQTYIQQLFDMQILTEHSKLLREQILSLLDGAISYSDFFARLLVTLFGEEGLVLIDSADPNVRLLEGEMFAQIIEENAAVSTSFQEAYRSIEQMGYTPQVENNPESAYLFIYEEGERLLLERDGDQFRIRNGQRTWQKEELVDLALTSPGSLSCNVVTRPLMQEYLFPVLAFIAGPGEISYWGLYRKIFQHFGMQLPIIMPRMTFTLVERHVQKLQEEYQLTFNDLIYHLDARKREWLEQQGDYKISNQFNHLRSEITQLYVSLNERLAEIDQELIRLGDQNLNRILDQVGYLEAKSHQAFEGRHQVVLQQFERAKLSLLPNGNPQERVYNLFAYINKYGWQWWRILKELHFEVNQLHKEVRI